jgi:hypothetical protein
MILKKKRKRNFPDTNIPCLQRRVLHYIQPQKWLTLLDIRKIFVTKIIKHSELVDLWGVGTIMYSILMGEPPFTDT